MTVSSDTTCDELPLLPIIHRTFPDIESYTIENNVVQANAEGFGITLNNSTNLFIKLVQADQYSHKPWGDLRRTLLYSRTEARFYSEILPLLQARNSRWDAAPKCFLAESTLHDLIDEDESTSATNPSASDPQYDADDTSILQNRGGILILESVKGEHFYQISPLTTDQASHCLRAIAQLHASAMGDADILSTVSRRLCEYGGSYHLKNRNPKELRDIEKTWEDFFGAIRDGETVPDGFFDRKEIQSLAKRVADMTEYISEELSPTANDPYCTIVHGDYKSMNVFLPSSSSSSSASDGDVEDRPRQPVIIDFASTGLGLGMSDVAMHITHALHPDNLVDGGEEALVEVYLTALNDALPDHQSYPKDVALRHYKLATVDYFRFIMGRLWRGASLETFEKRKDSMNSVFVNRSIEAAINFIERAERYLTELEEEKKKTDSH